ncbi:MAG: hypothetical protein PUD50_04525, partial [Eubacteriales bacterium]|nr:hypothetical protein [Eubacteriales bacterium]
SDFSREKTAPVVAVHAADRGRNLKGTACETERGGVHAALVCFRERKQWKTVPSVRKSPGKS